MLLRRVISHVRKQEWTAIAIDFVIVVLGVVVAAQVSNWNDVRKDREREQVYIERLEDDFEAIEARSKSAYDIWQSAVAASARLLEDIDTFDPEQGPVRPVEQISADLDTLLTARVPATQAPTFIEMLSSGDVALIRDAALRDALLAYDVQAHYSLESYRVLRNDAHEGIIVLAEAVEADLGGLSTDDQAPGPASMTSFADMAAVKKDVRFRNAIKLLGLVAYGQGGVASVHLKRAQDVLAALEAQR